MQIIVLDTKKIDNENKDSNSRKSQNKTKENERI